MLPPSLPPSPFLLSARCATTFAVRLALIALWAFLDFEGRAAALDIPAPAISLFEARAGHATQLQPESMTPDSFEQPSTDEFEAVKYPSELGDMLAYLSVTDNKSTKRPAIVWLTGGFPPARPNSFLWDEPDLSNEQSAQVYRHKGIVMLFPTVRGSVIENPGRAEGFYGEVNDVIAAGEFLLGLDYVDPKRVYLGGHSTGGTLALLVAESTDIFAGVICLGPVDTDYGEQYAPYQWTSTERSLREPVRYLDAIKSPTYVIEGPDGNYESLLALQSACRNRNVRFTTVRDASHFNLIHPVNTIFADAILASTDGTLDIDQVALASCYGEQAARDHDADDLRTLANLRENGLDLEGPRRLTYTLFAREIGPLREAAKEAEQLGFVPSPPSEYKDEDDAPYYGVTLSATVDLRQLQPLFRTTARVRSLAYNHSLFYSGWTAK